MADVKIDSFKKLDSPKCEYSVAFQKDRLGNNRTCGDMYNCCDCGTTDDCGCGCSYCFSCNACDHCKNDE